MSRVRASLPPRLGDDSSNNAGDDSNNNNNNSKEMRRQHSDSNLRPASTKLVSTDDGSSAGGSDFFSGPYEVIEYDAADDGDFESTAFLNDLALRIEDNTPAADALRANASVKVSVAGKAARAVNMQVVRKVMKRAAMKSKSGNVRGKPPRIPPTQQEAAAATADNGGAPADGSSSAGPPRRRASTDISLSAAKDDESSETIMRRSLPSGSISPIVDDEAHIEDDVVPGTREASKQGMFIAILYWVLQCTR